MAEQLSLNYEKIRWTYDRAESAEDSFDFTTRDADEAHIGLLLPAVQMAEAAPEPVDDFSGAGNEDAMQGHTLVELLENPGRSRVDDHDDWIDILAIDWGSHKPGSSAIELEKVLVTNIQPLLDDGGRSAGLRSDGELVQAVSDADMGGDFIL